MEDKNQTVDTNAAKSVAPKENKAKLTLWARIGSWFKKLLTRIAKPFRSMYLELKKVTWPTRRELVNYSVVVLVFMVIMGVLIGLFDLGAGEVVKWLTT